MANEYTEESEFIYIPGDDGKEEEFEVIMKFELEDGSNRKYVMVVPTEASDEGEEDEVYAFRYEDEGDDFQLFPIESDEEWDIVEETFNTLLAEEEI